MIKGIASFYNEQSSPNSTVALLGSVACPECFGKGEIELDDDILIFDECKRCSGDGLLTNQLQFNSQLMEAAMPQSVMTQHGLRLGDVLQVIRLDTYGKEVVEVEVITVRLTDVMGENDKGRVIDLTEKAFAELADIDAGLITVQIEKAV